MTEIKQTDKETEIAMGGEETGVETEKDCIRKDIGTKIDRD